jgi:uncharacterized Fe-S center protein
MVEHAWGALRDKAGHVGYVTFLMLMTKGCDCFGQDMKPIVPDVGILAGLDPVAMDAAALDLARDRRGKSLPEIAWSDIDPGIQIDYAAGLGLGSRDYNLIEV